MNKEEFLEELLKLNITPNKQQLKQLDTFYKLLIEYNNKLNLTRITDEYDVYLKHFYDSLTVAKAIDLNEVKTMCDVGTGAGFPGIVIKIIFPHIKIKLIDSKQKKVDYLNDIINKLKLENISAVHTRAEKYEGKFEIVISRAVANIETLPNYTMHLLDTNGTFIAMKGDIDKEINDSIKTKLLKKYKIEKIIKFYLPKENSKRSLVLLKNKK